MSECLKKDKNTSVALATFARYANLWLEAMQTYTTKTNETI